MNSVNNNFNFNKIININKNNIFNVKTSQSKLRKFIIQNKLKIRNQIFKINENLRVKLLSSKILKIIKY